MSALACRSWSPPHTRPPTGLFQERPEALAPVFEALGLPPPAKTDVHELSPDTTEIRPVERRADTVLMFEPEVGGHPACAECGRCPVPDDVRKQVTACTDLDTLTTWFDRSLTVTKDEDLFTKDDTAAS